MTGNDVIEELRRVDPKHGNGIDSLARTLIEQSREPARSAVALVGGSDPTMSEKARALLSSLDDLAIVPLLGATEPSNPFERVWELNTMVSAQLQLRDRVVAKLDSMLTDKTPIPWRTAERIEEKPQPSRVCDEAYLLMRRLLDTKEGRSQFIYDRKAFLALSDKRKDEEIVKAKKSREWTNLTGSEE